MARATATATTDPRTRQDPNRINITICGDGGCGKSSLTLRLVRSQWTHEYDPTIEDSYSVTRTVDGVAYLLSLTDTAGQEEYRALASSHSRTADAFLLVYDITSPASLYEQLPYFHDLVGVEADSREDRRECAPVVILAGNKCDLKHERRVSSREGLEWARARGCGFMETSARECVNVEETFALLVRRVLEARRAHALQNSSGSGPGRPSKKNEPKPRNIAEGPLHVDPTSTPGVNQPHSWANGVAGIQDEKSAGARRTSESKRSTSRGGRRWYLRLWCF